MNQYRENLLESHRESDWDDAHGCFTVARMVEEHNVKVMAEIGIGLGDTASEVLALNQVEKYFMVDCWVSEANYLKVRNNFQDKCVEIYREESMSAVNKFEDGCLDLIYVDAGKTFKSVLEDVRGWYRKLKIGGILVGDGYNHPQHTGVKQAVSRMFSKESIGESDGEDSTYWVFKE